MSGVSEDRWRGGRGGYDHNRSSGQRHHSGGYRDRHGQRNHGNNNNTATHNHNNSHNNNNVNASPGWSGPSGGPARETHIPVRGFNATELKAALRQGYQKGGPNEPQPMVYRPTGKTGSPVRASGPWASKPNTMGNGRDFFLELRKQLSAFHLGHLQGG
ncbi:hypothetical protein FQN57_003188 [Myotisia sp. PD_48]|nr:hypothetical protein FQN57_003188 [Myotisia sp. PD_48]